LVAVRIEDRFYRQTGHQDLVALPGSFAHSRCFMDRHADESIADRERVARMDPDPDLDVTSVGPRLFTHRALSRERRVDRVVGAIEHGEVRAARVIDDPSTVIGEDVAQQLAMARKNVDACAARPGRWTSFVESTMSVMTNVAVIGFVTASPLGKMS
jgi:hypothetical protein